MDRLEKIITVVSACLGLIATFTGFLVPLVKSVKAKNRLSALNKLTSTLQLLIVDAEKFVHYTGAEKKEYVLAKASRYAMENNIPYDEQAVSSKIEDLVALSKNVNKREKETNAGADSATLVKI